MCEGIGRHRAHGKGACGHPTVHGVYAHCCCGPRSFFTSEEEIEMLGVYKENLEKELKAVEERISKLRSEK